MEHLLDDVLLKVMQFLDAPALLACRLVCKRVASLALHPSVWRHQTCNKPNQQKCAWVCPVLSLAPCLRELAVGRLISTRCAARLATTRCAVEKLKLCVSEGNAMLATLVVRQQVSLGRLKRIELELKNGSDLELSVLLSDLSTICDLENSISSTAKPVSVPSLTHLTCSLYDLEMDLVNRVLVDHNATLEVVILNGPIRSTSKSTARLLASAPNLSTLNCALLPGMEALAVCKSLKTLWLYVCPKEAVAAGATAATVAQFLRRTKQLRRVTLIYGSGVSGTGQEHRPSKIFGAPLVKALAGHSCLEYLEMWNFNYKGMCLARPLLGALTSLPALRYVLLGVAMANLDALLLGITPAVVPALRTLKLFGMLGEEAYMRCIHSWIHREALTKLLLLNPSLDLIVFATFYCNEHLICEYCAAGCHHELQDEAQHEAEVENVDGEIHGRPCKWRFVPRPGTLIDRARGYPKN